MKTLIKENSCIVLTPKLPLRCKTTGHGLWSEEVRTVTSSKIEIKIGEVYTNLQEFAVNMTIYLNVFFTKKVWDTDKHGLIYTDEGWLKDFRTQFADRFPSLSWTAKKIDYTEHGMQGTNYVSLEIRLENTDQIKKFYTSMKHFSKSEAE